MSAFDVLEMTRDALRLAVDGRAITLDGEAVIRRPPRESDFRANLDALSAWDDGEPLSQASKAAIIYRLQQIDDLYVDLLDVTLVEEFASHGLVLGPTPPPEQADRGTDPRPSAASRPALWPRFRRKM